jgi:hypothetical protein
MYVSHGSTAGVVCAAVCWSFYFLAFASRERKAKGQHENEPLMTGCSVSNLLPSA